MPQPSKIRRALISVSDKRDVIPLARALRELGAELISTGGTARLLDENGIEVIEASRYTGFPEMMGGRVKTLHPRIHGGVLGRRGTDEAAMQAHDIPPIDMVVVNLYPFQQTVADPTTSLAAAIEQIDIGGPTLVRAAAKNHADVTVLVDPGDYARVITELEDGMGCVSERTRFELAVKAFKHTADYDRAIADYLARSENDSDSSDFGSELDLRFELAQSMRYGENPHQRAAFYVEPAIAEPCVATGVQLQGRELSYNNIADTDAALECVKQFEAPACVIVKHANPCGVAVGATLLEAYQEAYRTDPTSAFGGIIAFNRPLDASTAQTIVDRQFVEVIIAPGVEEEALSALGRRKNVRVLACGQWSGETTGGLDYKRVNGGLLVQDRDVGRVAAQELRQVTERAPTANELSDLLFAWKVVKFVKSNAIVYAREQRTVGIGAGQMSRVYSAKIAGIKAADEQLSVSGSVMASDAFFPFRDSIDSAAEVGIAAVIQPGGSVRDDEVVDAANEHGIAMMFTGMRHFRH